MVVSRCDVVLCSRFCGFSAEWLYVKIRVGGRGCGLMGHLDGGYIIYVEEVLHLHIRNVSALVIEYYINEDHIEIRRIRKVVQDKAYIDVLVEVAGSTPGIRRDSFL